MRRLDHGIGLIAKLPFAVGELELRGFQADTAGGFQTEPAMHVVVAEILAGAAEITSAATPEHQAGCEQHRGGCGSPQLPSGPDQMRCGRHVNPAFSGDGDDGRGLYPPPARDLRWFPRLRARSGSREESGPLPDRPAWRHPRLGPAAAKPHPLEIQ